MMVGVLFLVLRRDLVLVDLSVKYVICMHLSHRSVEACSQNHVGSEEVSVVIFRCRGPGVFAIVLEGSVDKENHDHLVQMGEQGRIEPLAWRSGPNICTRVRVTLTFVTNHTQLVFAAHTNYCFCSSPNDLMGFPTIQAQRSPAPISSTRAAVGLGSFGRFG